MESKIVPTKYGEEIVIELLSQDETDLLEYLRKTYPKYVKYSAENNGKHKYERYTIELNIRIVAPECNMPIIFGLYSDERNMSTTFNGRVTLQCGYIDSDVLFKNCRFNSDFIASNCTFKNDVYFDNTTFKDYADFNQCKFEKMASFYGVTFEDVINFFQAKFKGDLNLVNVNLAFGFDELRDRIKDDKMANDFRDSFRFFKNALIKDNNLLDASNFHKLELYCKEIELYFKKFEMPSRDWIEKITLTFCRYTSDHHTDLFKSFNSLLLVIAIFGGLSFVVIELFAEFFGTSNKNLYTSIKIYDCNIEYFISNNTYSIFIIDFAIFTILLFIIFVLYVVICDFGKTQYSIKKKTDKTKKKTDKKILWFFLCFYKPIVSLFVTIIPFYVSCFLLIVSPRLISPTIDIFTDNRSILDPLSIIGAFYTIFFTLMLYSLIKTARKNSIVPS